MPIEALRGPAGMRAIVNAWTEQTTEFDLAVTVATRIDGGPDGRIFVFSIGETAALLTFPETQALAAALIRGIPGGGAASDRLQDFGCVLLSVLGEGPGPYGAH